MRERRAREIDELLGRAMNQGYEVWFVTATVSHKLGDDLTAVRELVMRSWRAAFSGRAAQDAGYCGQVRSIEVTYGQNGWHPHIHAAVVMKPGRNNARVLAAFGTRYRQAVASNGGTVATNRVGWDAQPCRSLSATSSYLVKIDGGWGAGLEIARGDLKRAASGSVTPPVLLERWAAGDAAAGDLFRSYERAMHNVRVIVVSRKLSKLLAVELVSEAEAAAGEELASPVLKLSFGRRMWGLWRRRGLLGRLFEHCARLVVHGERLPAWIERRVLLRQDLRPALVAAA